VTGLQPSFLFVTCQRGAEPAIKHEIARDWPQMRFAYSRPGFLTFRLPADHALAADWELGSVFARTHGFSIGKIDVGDAQAKARQLWEQGAVLRPRRLHVWQRDRDRPGRRGYEPGITEEATALRNFLLENRPGELTELEAEPIASPGDCVLDCILIDEHQWWLGMHRARSLVSRYPGGFLAIEPPIPMVSRAYLKMEEALRWSELPIRAGDRCAEIGAAPGGSSQALLDRGLLVTGIDPAEMDPAILARPHFTHVRKRGHEVRRREFSKTRWLMADMNVAPRYTLDVVEGIVTHRGVNIRGMILTLKLLQWRLAEEIPRYLERIRSWGYDEVRARQLQYNRQEICVAALRATPPRKPPDDPVAERSRHAACV
jgi:23S rRNA (cytidine2498-2'-O)-methyltransferase